MILHEYDFMNMVYTEGSHVLHGNSPSLSLPISNWLNPGRQNFKFFKTEKGANVIP